MEEEREPTCEVTEVLSLDDIERAGEARIEEWVWPAFGKKVTLRSLSAYQIQQVQAESYRKCEFKQAGGDDAGGSMNLADLDQLSATIKAVGYSLVQPQFTSKMDLALRNCQDPEALNQIWDKMNEMNKGLLEAKNFKKKVDDTKKDCE